MKKKKFYAWLKERGALEKFKANMDGKYTAKQALKIGISPIGVCFCWNKSPEGVDYWLKLHDEFNNV